MDAPARTKRFAKPLRRTMSVPEVILWQHLRRGQLNELRIRRQHPIGPYVLDFYCHRARLAIEVDGDAVHGFGDAPRRDAARDAWLARQGVATVRIAAKDVLDELDGAIEVIRAAIHARLK